MGIKDRYIKGLEVRQEGLRLRQASLERDEDRLTGLGAVISPGSAGAIMGSLAMLFLGGTIGIDAFFPVMLGGWGVGSVATGAAYCWLGRRHTKERRVLNGERLALLVETREAQDEQAESSKATADSPADRVADWQVYPDLHP